MAKRKNISKKLRFEVFKRDKFTCQYCGAKAPDVVLHVDHITPVAEGGDNDIMNLVTACQGCNLGKGARVLSDDSAVAVKRKQVEELEARREQIEMMRDWQISQLDEMAQMVDAANELIYTMTGYDLTDEGMKRIRMHIKKFGYESVMNAIGVAFGEYDFSTEKRWQTAFNKIGGICYNRAHKTCKQCVNFEAPAENAYEVYCVLDDEAHQNREGDICPDYENRFRKSE